MSESSTRAEEASVAVFKADSVGWTRSEPRPGMEALAVGVTRRMALQDANGFFLQEVKMPAGHVIAPHSHSRGELIRILEGELTLDTSEVVLEAGDAIAIPPGTIYGFTVGHQGVYFMIVRAGEAEISLAD